MSQKILQNFLAEPFLARNVEFPPEVSESSKRPYREGVRDSPIRHILATSEVGALQSATTYEAPILPRYSTRAPRVCMLRRESADCFSPRPS